MKSLAVFGPWKPYGFTKGEAQRKRNDYNKKDPTIPPIEIGFRFGSR